MIQITVGTNLKNEKIFVDETTETPKTVFTSQNVIYTSATNYLDGCVLTPEDMNNTFEELGIKDSCTLISVIKLQNA